MDFGGRLNDLSATVGQRDCVLCRVVYKAIKDACLQRAAESSQGHNHYEGKPLFHRTNSQT